MAGGNADFTYVVDFQAKTDSLSNSFSALQQNLQSKPLIIPAQAGGFDVKNAQDMISLIDQQAQGLDKVVAQVQTIRDTNTGETFKVATSMVQTFSDGLGASHTQFEQIISDEQMTAKGWEVISDKPTAYTLNLKTTAGVMASLQKTTDSITQSTTQWMAKAQNMSGAQVDAAKATGAAILQEDAAYKQAMSDQNYAKAIQIANGMKTLKTTFDEQTAATERGAGALRGWTDNITNAIKQTISYSLSIGLVRDAQKLLADAIQFTTDMNTKLVQVQELQIQGLQTTSQINGLAQQYNQLAQSLGTTTTAVADSALGWLKQGYSVQESQQLVIASTQLAKLGMMDEATATNLLTSALNSFQMSASNVGNVMDTLATMASKTNTTVNGLSSAITYSGAEASQVGVSFDQLVSYIATVSNVTQLTAEQVGQSMKTMFARMTTLKQGSTDAGVSINNVDKALQTIGVSMVDADGNFRDMGAVMEDIAGKWNTLSQRQQDYIASQVAGLRQVSLFRALMGNMSDALSLQKDAMTDTGAATQKYGMYLESVEASQNKVKNAVQGLYGSFTMIAPVMVAVNDALASMITLVTKTGTVLPILGLLVGAFITLEKTLVQGAITTGLQKVKTFFDNIKASAGASIAALEKYAVSMETMNTADDAQILATKNLKNANDELAAARNRLAVATADEEIDDAELSPLADAVTVAYSNQIIATDNLTIANEGLTEAEDAEIVAQKEAAANSLDFIPVIGIIIMVVSALIAAYSAYANSQKAAADAIGKEAETLKTLIKTQKDNVSTLQSLSDEYDTLRTKTNLTTDEQQRLLDIQGQIAEIIPDAVTGFDNEGNALINLKTPMSDYIAMQETIIKNNYTQMQQDNAKLLKQQVGPGTDFAHAEKSLTELNNIKKSWMAAQDEIAKKSIFSPLDTALILVWIKEFGSLAGLEKQIADKNKDITATLAPMIAEWKTLTPEMQKETDAWLKMSGISQVVIDQIEGINDAGVKASPIFGDVAKTVTEAMADWDAANKTVADGLKDLESEEKAVRDAMKEQAENGYVSIDTANALVMADSDLADALEWTGKGYDLNKQKAIDRVGAQIAEYETLLLKTQAEYDDAAAIGADTTAIQHNIVANQQQLFVLRGLYTELTQPISYSTSGADKAAEAAKKAAQDASDARVKAAEAEKADLEQKLKDYQKIIDARKAILKSMHDEADYQATLAEKSHATAEVENELLAISLDNSEEAKAKRLTLEQDLVKDKTDLAKTEADHAYQAQIDALDKEYAAYKDMIDAETAALDTFIQGLKDALQAILAAIDKSKGTGTGTVKLPAVSAQAQLGTGLLTGGPEPIPASQYINANAIGGPTPVGGWIDGGTSNGIHWQRQLLSNGSYQYRKAIETEGPAPSGVKGAAGGLVTGGIPGKDSVKSMLMPGEFVIKKNVVDAVGLAALNNLNSKTSSSGLQFSMPINVEGNLDKSVLPDIEKIVNKAFDKMNSSMYNRGYKRTANVYST